MNAVRVGIVGLVAVIAATLGLGLSRQAGDGSVTGAAASEPRPSTAVPPGLSQDGWLRDDPRTAGYEPLPAGPTPEGKVPVVFNDDGAPGLAGYIDQRSDSIDVASPELDLGTEQEVRGWDVTDARGRLVGYFVSGLGFIDLDTARQPALVDALLTESEALSDAHPPASVPPAELDVGG